MNKTTRCIKDGFDIRMDRMGILKHMKTYHGHTWNTMRGMLTMGEWMYHIEKCEECRKKNDEMSEIMNNITEGTMDEFMEKNYKVISDTLDHYVEVSE